ncbi:MAG TPA: hypothetical protein VNO17_04700 [Actinomycetota bacterium]|nr:hypothetical protein [Actinomycetota bacterium]
MAVGELVFANVADTRVFDAYGEEAAPGIYLLAQPGRALPFTIFRAWKVPTGVVNEEVRFYGPSGRMVWRWGPEPRRMLGSMDLTVERDEVRDGFFDETGTYLASFILDEEIVGEIEVPVYVQQAPGKLPKEIEDGLKRSDVLWVGIEANGVRRAVPAWFAYRNGRIYVLSRREPGPDEQTIPGIPGAPEVVVVTRRKGRDTALERFPAAVRLLRGREWEEAAKVLADRRRSRSGPPGDAIARWRSTCEIAELTPVLPGA